MPSSLDSRCQGRRRSWACFSCSSLPAAALLRSSGRPGSLARAVFEELSRGCLRPGPKQGASDAYYEGRPKRLGPGAGAPGAFAPCCPWRGVCRGLHCRSGLGNPSQSPLGMHPRLRLRHKTYFGALTGRKQGGWGGRWPHASAGLETWGPRGPYLKVECPSLWLAERVFTHPWACLL